jgi:hypothetical protein
MLWLGSEATMTTRTNKKTITSKRTERATSRARLPKTAATQTTNLSQYLVPGAALLGSGLLTTAGVIMRKHLAEVLGSAARATLSQGAHAVAQLDPETLPGCWWAPGWRSGWHPPSSAR